MLRVHLWMDEWVLRVTDCRECILDTETLQTRITRKKRNRVMTRVLLSIDVSHQCIVEQYCKISSLH